jgi:hypothetical protein
MVLVDTNVLLDVATRDALWFDWSSRQLAPLINARTAAINAVISAELATPLPRRARTNPEPGSAVHVQAPALALRCWISRRARLLLCRTS